MLKKSSQQCQGNLFHSELLAQLDARDPLIQLAHRIPWSAFDEEFASHYSSHMGTPSKPIRRMVGLLMLKYLYDRSDESIVCDWKHNPYYQYFCGEVNFQHGLPCERIG